MRAHFWEMWVVVVWGGLSVHMCTDPTPTYFTEICAHPWWFSRVYGLPVPFVKKIYIYFSQLSSGQASRQVGGINGHIHIEIGNVCYEKFDFLKRDLWMDMHLLQSSCHFTNQFQGEAPWKAQLVVQLYAWFILFFFLAECFFKMMKLLL